MSDADITRTMTIDDYFRQLRMPGALRSYGAFAREAEDSGQGYLAFLESVLAQEMQNRHQN